MSKLQSDYIVQSGCHNCAHVFCMTEFDSSPEWYCTLNAPKRPRCGSVAMEGELSEPIGGPEYDADYLAWNEWERGRRVQSYGLCGSWTATPKEGSDAV